MTTTANIITAAANTSNLSAVDCDRIALMRTIRNKLGMFGFEFARPLISLSKRLWNEHGSAGFRSWALTVSKALATVEAQWYQRDLEAVSAEIQSLCSQLANA